MAHRQQLLVGRHLSCVQHEASIILGWLEAQDKSQREFERVKLALLSSGQSQAWVPEKLFPQFLRAPEPAALAEDAPLPADAPIAYDVEWKHPEELAADEFEALMTQIAELSTGSLRGDQVTDERWV